MRNQLLHKAAFNCQNANSNSKHTHRKKKKKIWNKRNRNNNKKENAEVRKKGNFVPLDEISKGRSERNTKGFFFKGSENQVEIRKKEQINELNFSLKFLKEKPKRESSFN